MRFSIPFPKRGQTAALIVAALALTIAGCGEPAPPAAPASPATTPAPAATTAPRAPHSIIRTAPMVPSTRASFSGPLPCTDCTSEAAQLTLQHDQAGRNRYVLDLTVTRDGKPHKQVEMGSWKLSIDHHGEPPLVLIHLDSGRPDQSHLFTLGPDGGLESLAASGYRLKRDGGRLDLDALAASMAAPPASSGSAP